MCVRGALTHFLGCPRFSGSEIARAGASGCECARLPGEERAATERCCTPHRAGLQGFRARRAKSTRMQRCWGSRRPHPLGSAPRPSLLVTPGVFPKAALVSLLFAGKLWVLLHTLRRAGLVAGRTGKGERQRERGLRGLALCALCRVCAGHSARTGIFPQEIRRELCSFIICLWSFAGSWGNGPCSEM